MAMGIFQILLICLFVGGGYLFVSYLRKDVSRSRIMLEYSIVLAFVISSLLFCFGMLFYSEQYETAIDPIDVGYSLFGGKHILTLFVFLIFSLASMILLWLKGRQMPPLILVFSLVFVIIGVFISVLVIMQISGSQDSYSQNGGLVLMFYSFPIMYIFLSVALILKVINEEVYASVDRKYSGKIMNCLNRVMIESRMMPVWVVILILPVFCVVTIVLLLFGQDVDSISKVFTETTTWSFSQKAHPPYLDHEGHYLCTVAAFGHKSVVKPLRYGIRHNRPIVVNRQLLIANAFEDKVLELSPSFHRFIRGVYDKYGYPLSKRISTPLKSDIVYILMKPLEYFFLITLYLSDINPEDRIARQYKI